MLRFTLITCTTFLLLFTTWSCSDDSPTGPSPEDAPEAPSLEEVEMDFSIFENAESFYSIEPDSREALKKQMGTLADDEYFTAYEQAAFYAFFAEIWFQTMGSLPAAYFNEHQWGDPEVDGDTWIWEWNHHFDDELYFSMRITAETLNNERHWELRYTVQWEEEDENLDNALLIASQVRLDGSGGSWQMHDFFDESDDPIFKVDYDLDGDLATRVNMEFDEEEDGRFLYQSDGSTGSLEFWDALDSGYSIIEWDNETGAGSIQSPNYRGGEKVCWDEDFQNTDDC